MNKFVTSHSPKFNEEVQHPVANTPTKGFFLQEDILCWAIHIAYGWGFYHHLYPYPWEEFFIAVIMHISMEDFVIITLCNFNSHVLAIEAIFYISGPEWFNICLWHQYHCTQHQGLLGLLGAREKVSLVFRDWPMRPSESVWWRNCTKSWTGEGGRLRGIHSWGVW